MANSKGQEEGHSDKEGREQCNTCHFNSLKEKLMQGIQLIN